MVEFKTSNKEAVTEAEMQAVYKKIATPHKLGAVIKWEDFYTDSPTVFKKRRCILYVFHCDCKGLQYFGLRNTSCKVR